ncbi:competence type IV pilus assembly protein ComGB [Hutsoniella sourekii]|uniref:competence type IV pilus assembly protein ComGB n=1 Tax=Hutsoniella sourekii TaxID=87650 RepID=UPI000482D528|nr:competence type IV pilus assembly protein ComGB [Hutsoniella sourekii]
MALSARKTINFTRFFKSRSNSQIPSKIRPYFLMTLAELLEQGFSLQQSLAFMQLILPKQASLIQDIQDQVAQGQGLETVLRHYGYSIGSISNLFYAKRQGRFNAALMETGQHLAEIRSYQAKFIKVLIYPVLMSLFLLGLLFGMRVFLLPHITSFISPQVYQSQWMVRLLLGFFTFLPHLAVLGLTILVFLFIGVEYYLMRLSPLERILKLVRWRGLGRWVRQYCSYKFAREIGYFFQGGFSMQQALEVLVTYPIDPLMSDIAKALHQGYLAGGHLPDLIEELGIFTRELPLIIHQGELLAQTASKCHLYSQKIFEDLLADIERVIQWVQPVLFVGIAILIMALYLLIMLPMFTMEGL